jgi:hypothetical protein
LESDFLKKIVPILECDENIGMLLYQIKEKSSGLIRPNYRRLEPFLDKELLGNYRFEDWKSAMIAEPLFCSGSNVAIRRNIAMMTLFDENARNFEDWEYYFSCALKLDLEGLKFFFTRVVALQYTDDDMESLSRSYKLSDYLKTPPNLVHNVNIPLSLRRFVLGLWLVHVNQRSSLFNSLKRTIFFAFLSNIRPSFYHLTSGVVAGIVSRKFWVQITQLRKAIMQ